MLEKPIQKHTTHYILPTLITTVLLQLLLVAASHKTVAAALNNTSGQPSQSAPPDISMVATQGISNTSAISDASSISSTLALTLPALISDTLALTISVPLTISSPLTSTESISETGESTATASSDAAYSSIISGTIIANRTEQQALFFVEGATYLLDPLRSIGLQLPRSTAAVNLYNCDARTPEDQKTCFWDPYLLTKDGFYEIVSGNEAGKVVNLVLREAGSPPTNKVYIQNRTGKSEKIFFGSQEVEIQPASIKEFEVPDSTPSLVYLHNCVTLDGQTACEWAPRTAIPGLYYGLVEKVVPGSEPNSQVVSIELQEVLTAGTDSSSGDKSGGDNTTANSSSTQETPQAASPQVVCRTLVPALNVRSGPGLQYTIIQKVRIGGSDPASVIAVGRDESGQWLAVDDRIAPGGWVIASSNFMQCEGDTNALPITKPTIAELQPTPTASQQSNTAQQTNSAQQAETAPSEGNGDTTTPTEETAATPESSGPTIPEGYALLVVNNGFENTMRFTLDQRYRMELGPSEFDLPPGGSISIVVIPGQIAFTASTPGHSGNADFTLEKDQTRVLWLTFVTDPGSPGQWILQY